MVTFGWTDAVFRTEVHLFSERMRESVFDSFSEFLSEFFVNGRKGSGTVNYTSSANFYGCKKKPHSDVWNIGVSATETVNKLLNN